MATTISSISIKFFLSAYLLSLCLLCSSNEGYASEGRQTTESQDDLRRTQTVQLSSLLPSSVCKSSTKDVSGNDGKSSLKIVHKHGPCFEPNGDKAKSPSLTEVLLLDQARVKSIHSRLSNKNSGADEVKATDAATIPAKDGSVVGSGSYIVTVGLGTPKKELSLAFDTGSQLTWVQCQPCLKSCYEQKEPIFDPAMSTTYTNISCSSKLCNSRNPGSKQSCIGSACAYGIQYGDNSFSIGFLSKETLALSSDVFPNFLFGCGQDNEGLFKGEAGLLGLGRRPISIVSQTAQKYNKLFSYCLPSSPSSTGHLTFGNGGGLSKSVKFTPLSTVSKTSNFYGLDIIGLSVGGQKLPISNSVFSTSGAIIDSGTTITRLPPAAYTALRSAFRSAMAKYPMVSPPASLQNFFDTCYDLSNYSSLTVPTISFLFNGGAEMSIDATGVFYAIDESKLCLAFASNSDASKVAILGNVQQKTLEVVYDAAGGRVGFAPKGCS